VTNINQDRWIIVANVFGDKVLRNGATVTVLGVHGDMEGIKVRGLSRGGRKVTKYTRIKRLRSWRVKWCHKDHIPDTWLVFGSKEEATSRANQYETNAEEV